MEKFIENKITKIVFAVVILFTMIFSYVPAISNAAEDDDIDYMSFDASCKAGTQITSNQNVAFGFNFNLKGVQTGFKNVTVSIKDEDTTSPAAIITSPNDNKLDDNTVITNNERYSIIKYGNIRTGTDFSGTVNIVFDRKTDFSTYAKTIKFLFEADYRDPVTGITARQTIEKDITVNVASAPIVDKFSANVEIMQNKYNQTLGERIPGNDYLGAHYVYKYSDEEYAIDQVKASYNVKINAENLCYGQYILKVSKSPEFRETELTETNSEENLIIDLSQVPDEFAKNVVRNEDGTADIILTYKTKKDEYTLEDMDETTYYDFNIVVTYKIKFSIAHVVRVPAGSTTSTTTATIYNTYTYVEGSSESTTNTTYSYSPGGNYFVNDYQSLAYNNKLRESVVLASRDTIDRAKLLNIKLSAVNPTQEPVALLAEGEIPDNIDLVDARETTTTITGTSSNSSKKVTTTTTNTVTVKVYEKSDIEEYVNEENLIPFDEHTDQIVTESGTMVTIRGVYTGVSEGLDIYRSLDTTTQDKKTINYLNSDLSSFLSASTIIEEAGGSEIEGLTTYLDNELEAIENGNFEISFTSKGSIMHKKETLNVGELCVYNYNVEDVFAFFDEENMNYGNLYYEDDCRPTIKYTKDNGYVETKTLQADDLKVKEIVVTDLPAEFAQVEFYKKGEAIPFFIATENGQKYVAQPNDNISEYYTKTNIGTIQGGNAVYWTTTYKVPVSRLNALGLSDTEIANITDVTKYQYGSYNGGNCTMIQKGTATIVNPDKLNPKISYMEISAKKKNGDNFNTSNINKATEPVLITFTFKKDQYGTRGENCNVYNVNPVIYLKLNKIFDFENFKVNITNNAHLTIENTEKVVINEQEYLKIECDGTYDSSIDGIVNITVDCYRTLIDNSAAKHQLLEGFLITENQNYYSSYDNMNGLIYNEEIPAKLFKANTSFTVEQSNLIQAYTSIRLGRREYTPNSVEEQLSFSEKETPAITKSNTTITFRGDLKNIGKTLNNVNLIFKLPLENNKAILYNENLIEDDYRLTSEYNTKYGSVLNAPNNQDGTVKHISLENLDNIKVYIIANGVMREMDPSRYTLGYSEDLDADFDSTFTEIDDGVTDLTDAAVLQVRIDNLDKSENVRIDYTMDMPDEGGMVASQFGARYIEDGAVVDTELDSEAVYVINGNDASNLQIQKKFEGYDVGIAPAGLSLAGIQFKLKDSSENFVQSDGSDLVVTTDATGKATFSNLVPGQYQLIEISEFDEFNGIGNLAYINLGLAETVEYEAENPRKTGKLNIKKHFEDTNEIKGRATFKLTRNSEDSLVYSTSIETDAEGKATISGIPYGEYTLTETNTVSGYGIPEAQTITIDSETKDIDVTNPLGRGTIIINKTVPETESVKEVSFYIAGLGAVSYTNTDGETITNDTDLTINLNDDYSSNENIDVEIAENELTAKITLSNLPLGFYTIQETNIPTIGEDNVSKYTNVTRTVSLEEDGKEETVNIINRKKTGYLQIKKTAYIDGEEKQYIGDLSQFSVRITGTSDYGTPVDKTVSFDVDGKATTALEIGTYTVTEIPVDGYQTYYKNSEGNLVYSTTGTEVKITFNDVFNKGATTTQEIENVLTGVGFVRIEKTLEGITNPQTVLDAGIKFKITGKNAAGGRVEETINIDQLDTEKNIAYGISNAILVGGDYELEEVYSTVPEYFEGMAPRAVTFTTSSTQENPLVLNVQNDRAKGELQISTQTDPEGGPLTGITYRVTEVKINNDGSYTKLDGTNGTENTVQEVEGSNGQSNPSFADITEINAGNYLVEQVKIPAGYKKDMPQIVEVPAYGIGYAVFVIEKDDFNKYTKLVVNKQILNKNNEIATSADFEKAQLSVNDSFEVKVTNVNTKEEYYTFISGAQKGTITDLPAGIYEIEEEYKPKYILKGYYNSVDGIAVDELVQTADGKYTFEIVQGSSETVNTVEITIKNTINTSFPYGGQTTVDNMSKLNMEKVEIVTEAIVYILDEDGKELPGAKFQLLDSQGNVVNIGTEENILTTKNKKILIRGLESGKYTLTNIEVPEGYLQPDDKDVVVYEDATRVSRVEIQKNIPRGMLTLSTTYVNSSGDTKYVPRSKYKVVDSQTGKLVTFTKTATGDYRKSNLDDATEIITLKAGQVEVQGLEAGRYEVGLVDVTDGFAMQNEEPEYITLVGNDEQDINVVVAKAKTVKATAGYYNTMWLDDNGRLWIIGGNHNYSYGILNKNINDYYNINPYQIQFPEDVFIINYHQLEYSTVALDSQGRVWIWGGNGSYIGDGTKNATQTPICLSEIEGTELNEAYKNGVKIVDVNSPYQYNYLLLDSDGKVWSWGYNNYGTVGNNSQNDVYSPICLTNIEDNPLYEAYDNGIKIVKLADMAGTYYTAGCIDSIGRVWMWGDYNNGVLGVGPEQTSAQLVPKCISNIESEFSNAKIEYLSIARDHAFAVDSEGNVWAWGSNRYGQLGLNDKNIVYYYPERLSNDLFGGAKINKAYSMYLSNSCSMFIDEYGKVWVCGSNSRGCLGNGEGSGNVYIPQCISTLSELDNIEIVSIENSLYSNNHVIALDKDGAIWGWGGNSNRGELGALTDYNDQNTPKKIVTTYTKHLEYNLKFEKVISGQSTAVAIDEYGDVWTIGYGYYNGLGYSSYSTTEFQKIPTLIGKKVIDITHTDTDCYLALTEDGRVYIWGYCDSGLSMDSNKTTLSAPCDVTDKFNLEDEVKIVGISMAGSSAAVVDSQGRVWTWGSGSYGFRGNGDSTYSNYTPICISVAPNDNLYGVNVKSIYGSYYGYYAIDDEGRVWYWGQNYGCGIEKNIIQSLPEYNSSNLIKPVCITNFESSSLGYAYAKGTKFVKAVDCESSSNVYALLDSEGKVWLLYGYTGRIINNSTERVDPSSNTSAMCLNDLNGHILNEQSKMYDGYKIEDIISISTGLIIKDNQGQIWCLNNSGVIGIAGEMYSIPSDIKSIDSYNDSYAYLIDGYGQLWKWLSETKCLSGVEENPLYNIKAKEILKSNVVQLDTEKGEIYKVTSEGSEFIMYSEDYISRYLGKNIVQIEKHIESNFTDCYIIALDEDGDMWYCGGSKYADLYGNVTKETSNRPVCINKINGTELYNECKNDSNFKLEKFEIYGDSSSLMIIATDNYGRIWTWGNNVNNKLGHEILENQYTPTCLMNIENTDLYEMYNSGEWTGYRKIYEDSYSYFMLDNSGNLWTWGRSSVSPVCLNKIKNSDLYLELQSKPSSGIIEELYEGITNKKEIILYEGKIWDLSTLIDYNASTDINCLNYNNQIFTKLINTYDMNTFAAIDTDGKIWTWGYNGQRLDIENGEYTPESAFTYLIGDGTTETKDVTVPICISNIPETDLYKAYQIGTRIVDIELFGDYAIIATDNNGDRWVWGYNLFGELGTGTTGNVLSPYCMSTPITETGAQIKKIEMYSYIQSLNNCSYNVRYTDSNYNTISYRNSRTTYKMENVAIALDTNGNIWTCGGSAGYKFTHEDGWNLSYTNKSSAVTGAVANKLTLSNVSSRITNVNNFYVSDIGSVYAFSDDCMYVWGNNNNAQLGLGYYTNNSIQYYYTRSNLYEGWDDSLTYYYYSKIQTYDHNIYTPIKVNMSLPNSFEIIVGNGYAIDNEGKLWALGLDGRTYTDNQYIEGLPVLKCYSDISTYGISGIKFTDIIYNKENGETFFVDENNNKYSYNSEQEKYVIVEISEQTTSEDEPTLEIENTYGGDLEGKTIKQINSTLAIDTDGNLYGWNSTDGIYYISASQPLCITNVRENRTAVFQDNKTLVNIPIENNTYGVKFTDIINDQIVLDENGDYWFFPDTGKAINISKKMLGEDNPLYGKTITKAIDSNYVVASDNGIYYIGGTVPEYIMQDFTEREVSSIEYKLGTNRINYYVAIDTDGKVWTCGSATYGILGNGSLEDSTEPICISDIEGTQLYNKTQTDSNFKMSKIYVLTDSNMSTSCSIIALDSYGRMWSWGKNTDGILGNGTEKYTTRPICINDIEGTELAIASEEEGFGFVEINNSNPTYAIDTNKHIWAWGLNKNGMVGNGTTNTVLSPTCLSEIGEVNNLVITSSGLTTFERDNCYVYLSGSSSYAINIDSNGKVWTWGYNSSGSMGNGTSSSVYEPICISETAAFTEDESEFVIEKIIKIGNAVYAISSNKKLWVWGYGSLGTGSSGTVLSPKCISNMEGTQLYEAYNNDPDFEIVNITSGTLYDNYGRMWKIESNKFVCYGNTTEDGILATCNQKGITIQKQFVNNNSVYILDTDGKVWVWGYNANGRLGTGNTNSLSEPVCLTEISGTDFYSTAHNVNEYKIVDMYVSSGSNPTVYLVDSEKYVWSWGYNSSYGLVGNGSTSYVTTPTRIANIGGIERISTNISKGIEAGTIYRSTNNVFALDIDGKIWAWGYNASGQLGNGTTTTSTTPVCLSNISGELRNAFTGISGFKIIKIYGIGNSIYALDNQNKIWSWGYNSNGVLGTGNTTNVKYPTCISNIANTALKNEYNTSGFGIEKFIPGSYTNYMIDTFGRVWAWGYNNYGQIGNGNTTSTYTPTCITNINNRDLYYEYINNNVKIVDLIANNSTYSGYVFARDNQNRLWVWGYNTNKELGIQTPSTIKDPVLLQDIATGALKNAYDTIDDFNFEKLYIGSSLTCAIDNQGKIWITGLNTNGQLGIGQGKTTNEFICLSDIEGSNLNNAYLDNPSLKAEEITISSNSCSATFNDGTTWNWGNKNGKYLYVPTLDASEPTTPTTPSTPNEPEEPTYDIVNIETFSKFIAEVLDGTHIKDTNGKIYSITSSGSDVGKITELSTYTPPAQPEYEPVEIDGVTIVDYSTYKALDNEGNLYAWSRYMGGYTSLGDKPEESLIINEEEYIIEPLYQNANGWSLIKVSF